MGSNVEMHPGGQLADRFAALWNGTGPPPDLLAYLGDHEDATPGERLAVVFIDQAYRWRTGTPLSFETYLRTVPGLDDEPGLADELRGREVRLRLEHGESPGGPTPPPGPPLRPKPAFDEPTDADPVPTEPRDASSTAFAGSRTQADESTALNTKGDHKEPTDVDFSLDSGLEVAEPGDSTERLLSLTRFTIEDRIGTGGMGVVYRAHDPERGEVVALKTMRQVDPKALYRFKQEFRTLADLSHPNLVNLYELVASDDVWYYTMELIEGVDFIRHVRGASDAPSLRGGRGEREGRREGRADPRGRAARAGAGPAAAAVAGATGGGDRRRCTTPGSFTATSSRRTCW